MIKPLSKILAVLFLVLASVGCMPRGETITLDQSLDIAKERFASAMMTTKDKVPAELVPALDNIKSGLERLAATSNVEGYQQESKTIAETLKPLIMKTGYTSRPALDEIVKQYVIASEGSVQIAFAPGTAKLLAQRTYHVLSAELESTRFSL